jgi:hypothetical protein
MNNPDTILARQKGWLPTITITLLTIVIFIVSVVSLLSGWQTIFQNLFYFPIILACVYYVKRGFVFSVLLACCYIVLMAIFSNDPVVLEGALIRVLIFILVAGVITYLSLIRIRAEDALKESNKRFLEFLKEAAMRLKTPLEVIEENIAGITSDIERGGCDPADMALQLKIQMKNVEQIRQNIIELNKAITEHGDELSDATRKFLME